jgi:hypothetical protein
MTWLHYTTLYAVSPRYIINASDEMKAQKAGQCEEREKKKYEPETSRDRSYKMCNERRQKDNNQSI